MPTAYANRLSGADFYRAGMAYTRARAREALHYKAMRRGHALQIANLDGRKGYALLRSTHAGAWCKSE